MPAAIEPSLLPEFYHSDDEACTALIRLEGLGSEKARRSGNILHDRELRRKHSIANDRQGSFNLKNLLEGNLPLHGHSSRLFEVDNEEGTARSSLLLADLRLSDIERDADEFFNQSEKAPWRPMTVVKALTVDGQGGEFTYEDGQIGACPWLYVELGFIVCPAAADLVRISAKRDTWSEPRRLGHPFMVTQEENLYRWFQRYRGVKDKSPTRRPVAERYYSQLKELGLQVGEERDLGVVLFGPEIFARMEAQRNEIFKALKRL